MRVKSKRPQQSKIPCDPITGEPITSLEQIVTLYIEHHREQAAQNLQFFQERASLAEAIEYAALAKRPNDKRHWHQRRIPLAALQESHRRLQGVAAAVQACTTFTELHHLVEKTIADIPGIGELTLYDTALHIGAYLELKPDAVYIHRGVRSGLSALGLFHGQHRITVNELPEPFHRLQPHEIEDCLCIYKDELKQIKTPSKPS